MLEHLNFLNFESIGTYQDVILEKRPVMSILENVKGICDKENKPYVRAVLKILKEAGYTSFAESCHLLSMFLVFLFIRH